VHNRRARSAQGAPAAQYSLLRDDGVDATRPFHGYTAVRDPDSVGEKKYWFSNDPGPPALQHRDEPHWAVGDRKLLLR
jgi:hypothetical protein